MSTAQNTATLDSFEIATLNEARAILQRFSQACSTEAWKVSATASYPAPSAGDFGRVSAKAETAADAIFDTLNNAKHHGVVPEITDGQLHNRVEEAWPGEEA